LAIVNPVLQLRPCRSASDGVTYYSYDALGRPADVGASHAIKYPDGGYTSITYSGNCATVADPARNGRKACRDALGRVTSLAEDPNGLNYQTNYTYDALDDLIGAAQGNQSRTYSYDMLGRLTSARTPEAGTTSYSYASSGNPCSGDPTAPCSPTDARGIATTYAYDALNRLSSKTYSDGTPTANFFYDQTLVTIGSWVSPTLLNPLGRLTEAVTIASGSLKTAMVYSYDSMGRTSNFWQCNPSNCGTTSIWNTQYNYDLAGDVTSWLHPAGYTLTNTVTQAQQVTAVQRSPYDSSHPQVAAQNITYTPWGAVSGLQNGCVGTGGCTNAQETYTYNNRLQPVTIELGTTGNATADYCMVYNYYSDVSNPTSCSTPSQGAKNNGNVMGYWYEDGVQPFSHTAAYIYDNVNRLLTAAATPFGSGTVSYNLNFNDYDPYGNMTCVQNANTNGPCPQWAYNTNTNQLSTSTGCTYDAAGNLTKDCSTVPAHTYQWDAEGRVSTVDPGNNPPPGPSPTMRWGSACSGPTQAGPTSTCLTPQAVGWGLMGNTVWSAGGMGFWLCTLAPRRISTT
jgi:YD repeat-containing protein